MSQSLMIRFGADVSAAKRAIVELATTTASNAVTMGFAIRSHAQNADALATALGKVPDVAKRAFGALLVFATVKLTLDSMTAAARAAYEQMEKLTTIAGNAKKMGVGTTFLQSWMAQAKELKIEARTLEQMLERARNAASIRLGDGETKTASVMSSRLSRHREAGNISKAEEAAYTNAASQEERIRVVLDMIDRLMAQGRALAGLNIADAMFGQDFEERLRAGVDMTGKMREALNGLTATADGRIVPPEEIARAEKLAATLREAERVMAEALRPVREDIARIGQQDAQTWAEMKVNLAHAVDYLMKVYSWGEKIRAVFAEWGHAQIFKDLNAWMDKHGLMDKSVPPGFADPNKPEAPAAPEAKPLELRIAPKNDKSAVLPKLHPTNRGSEGVEERNPVDQLINSLEKSTAALKGEIDAYDKSNREKKISIELAKAEEVAKQNGITVTEEQTKRIRAAAEAAANYKDKLADLDQKQREAAEGARFMGQAITDGLGDILIDGRKAIDVVSNLSKTWARAALNAFATGSGPLAGFFGTSAKASDGNDAIGGLLGAAKSATKDWNLGDGLKSLFSGFRANGGPVAAGRAYRINEAGEEWFVPMVDGRVMPASAGPGRGTPASPAGAATGRPVVVHFRVESPDAAGFARSEGQVTGMLARAVQRGMRGA